MRKPTFVDKEKKKDVVTTRLVGGKGMRSLTGAFCPASQTRVGITPSPTRVLSSIPCAFLGSRSFRASRVFRQPNSSHTLAAIPRARDGVKPSRQFNCRSFITLVGYVSRWLCG